MTHPATPVVETDHDRLIAATRALADEPRPGQRVSHQNLMAAARLLSDAAEQEKQAGNPLRASEINALVIGIFQAALRVEDFDPYHSAEPSPYPTLPAHVAAKVREGHTLENDPPHGLSRVNRWTCTTCGDAVLDSGTVVYGGATERSCPESVTFWARSR